MISITKSFTTKCYCLLHYYTTKACRISTDHVQIINGDNNGGVGDESRSLNEEWNTQLPYTQTLFKEAFTELQNEISTESERSFHSMVERNDPLSILTMDNSSTKKISNRWGTASAYMDNKKISTEKGEGDDDGGGFLHQAHSKERKLMREQSRRIEKAARESINTVVQVQENPYKRRKTSSKSSWHLVLSSKKGKNNNSRPLTTAKIDFTSTSVEGITCSCGSKNIELCGNVTSRNNNVSKADTWGFKRDDDVKTIVRCTNCNKTWSEEN